MVFSESLLQSRNNCFLQARGPFGPGLGVCTSLRHRHCLSIIIASLKSGVAPDLVQLHQLITHQRQCSWFAALVASLALIQVYELGPKSLLELPFWCPPNAHELLFCHFSGTSIACRVFRLFQISPVSSAFGLRTSSAMA